MIALILAMTTVIFMWVLIAPALIGLGTIFTRLNACTDWLLAFWLGLALCIALLQAWHMFFPVNTVAFWGIMALGWGKFIGCVRSQQSWRVSLPFIMIMTMLTVFTANQALQAPTHYDSGLYQLQSIQWTNTYSIVPGLGNLHGRLAFNNSYHLYVAMLNASPLDGRGTHLANGLPLLFLAAGGISAILQLVQRQPLHATTVYQIMMIPVTLRHLYHLSLPNPDSDLIALLVGLVALGHVIQMLEEAKPSHLILLAILVSFGVTLKLSFGVLGLSLAIFGLMRHLQHGFEHQWRIIMKAVFIGLIIVGIWSIRGVVLSGYPFYPSQILPLPVDWRMPPEIGQQELAWIRAWARQPNVLGDDQFYSMPMLDERWLRAWVLRTLTTTPNLFDVTLPLVIVASMIIYQLLQRRNGSRYWLVMVPLIIACLFWWFTAPDPRFAGAIFWGMGASSVSAVFTMPTLSHIQRGSIALAIAIVCAILLPVQYRLVLPADETGFYTVPTPELGIIVSTYGATYHYPTNTDQCWDVPLPCAPHYGFTADLCERDPGNLRAGYAMSSLPNSQCD